MLVLVIGACGGWEGDRSPWNWCYRAASCHVVMGLKPRSLVEQPVLITTELSLQSPKMLFNWSKPELPLAQYKIPLYL